LDYPKSSPGESRHSRRLGAAGVLVALFFGACSRETIGLGLAPDASAPMLPPAATGTSSEQPPQSRPDAAPPSSSPTSAPAASAPSLPDPVNFPRPSWARDAGVSRTPTKTDHPTTDPPTEVDAAIGCRQNSDCRDLATPVCRLDTGECVRCISDVGCPYAAPRCDPLTNECGCITPADCHLTGACDSLTHQCLIGCVTPAHCNLFAPFCDAARGVCLQCMDDPDCHGHTYIGTPTELCKNGFCVQCREEADCADLKRHCSVRDGACVECLHSDHCGPGQTCHDERCYPPLPQPGP
jgi:hypothetical protein